METWPLTKHVLVFFSQCVWVRMPFWEWNIKKMCWFHISNFTQVGKKTILHFWAYFSEGIYQCSLFSGDHVMSKTPGSELNTWSWKQKLVGVSRTCRIIWKIMKIMRTEKFSKIPKNENYFTCLLFFRIMVNFPNFEMLSHLNELDVCELLKTE